MSLDMKLMENLSRKVDSLFEICKRLRILDEVKDAEIRRLQQQVNYLDHRVRRLERFWKPGAGGEFLCKKKDRTDTARPVS